MEALVQARGVKKANQGPTTSVIEHMPHFQLGRLRAEQSQITVAMLWYVCHGCAWVCTEEVNASPALGAFVSYGVWRDTPLPPSSLQVRVRPQ